MADRFRPANQPNPPRNRAAAPQPQPQPVARRNLFQNGGGPNARAARRPAPVSATSTETTVLDAEVPGSESSEIVVRDSHGEVEIGDPPTPDMDDPGEEGDEDKQEMEQERQRLSEAVKQHQDNNVVPDQPEELLEAVRASLRAKVTALSEDNWMYETEDNSRGA